MAKREKFTTAVRCECGNSGMATWEENENYVYGAGVNSVLIAPPADFQVSDTVNSDGDPQFVCGRCHKTCG